MTDRELMQRALEALEWNLPVIEDYGDHEQLNRQHQAITALRERLAQPEPDWDWRHPKAQSLIGAKARLEIKLRLIEQLLEDPNFETTAFDMEYWEPLHDKLQKRLAQPEQEPVAHTLNCVCGVVWDIKADGSEEMAHTPDTTPPQRKPLTHPQIHEFDWPDGVSFEEILLFVRAVEAAHGIKVKA